MNFILELLSKILGVIPKILDFFSNRREIKKIKTDIKHRKKEVKEVDKKDKKIKKIVDDEDLDEINDEFGWKE